MPGRTKIKNRWYLWRRFTQVFCLVLFLFLFIKTDYSGSDEIPYAVNLLFRIDPLLALCASLAAKTIIVLMLPALAIVLLTLLFGRFFCGWFCPLGTLLDGSRKIFGSSRDGDDFGLSYLKYYLLVFLLFGSFFGLPIAGYFDPFSILVRGLALALYPALNVLNTSFFTFTYQQAPAWVNAVTEPLYTFLKLTVLPFHQNYFDLAVLSLVILLLIFFLEKVERRFFCRNICPLGGLLALVARYSLLHGQGGSSCGKCSNCVDICRMSAIDEQRNISPMNCNLCMDCVAFCPGSKISFRFGTRSTAVAGLALDRRSLVGAMAAGALLPLVLKTRTLAAHPNPALIRPPGALLENKFLGRCVRCGECMKVCIGNALQPSFMEAGLEGMFTPRLKARTGYCEYNCTLCGQVCPTGAIERLDIPRKQSVKIGHAFFDKNRCLPYANTIPCIVCEEHCPTPDKAIKFHRTEVINSKGESLVMQQPYLVDALCIGCGICETKCPLPGEAAVRVTSAGESRNPSNNLPFQN